MIVECHTLICILNNSNHHSDRYTSFYIKLGEMHNAFLFEPLTQEVSISPKQHVIDEVSSKHGPVIIIGVPPS